MENEKALVRQNNKMEIEKMKIEMAQMARVIEALQKQLEETIVPNFYKKL